MKRLLLIVLPLLLIVGCSKPKNVNTLRFDSYGLPIKYKNSKQVPFSGKVYEQKLGGKISEGKYKDGMIFGAWKFYDDNGNKIKEIDYKIFKSKKEKYSYYTDVNNHKIKDGNYLEYFDNGVISTSGNFKENLKVGLWNDWFKNKPKQRATEVSYNEYGREEGKQTNWEINGRVNYTLNYKDGDLAGFKSAPRSRESMSGYWDLGVFKFNLYSNGTGTVKSVAFGIDQTAPLKWRISDDVILWEQTDGKGSGTGELYIRDGGKRLSLLP